MRKTGLVASALVFVILSASSSYCAEEAANNQKQPGIVDTADMRYDKSPINKLGRGLLNTVTFFNEVPAGFFTVSAEKDEIAGWTIGLVDGVATSLLRLFSGVFDTVTFILPPYNKPLMTPEYSWQSLEQSRHRYEDSLADK